MFNSKKEKGILPFLLVVQIDYGALLAFCLMGNRGFWLGLKRTVTLHVIPRLSLRKDVPPLPFIHLHIMMRT
jgi:hypothetical protein